MFFPANCCFLEKSDYLCAGFVQNKFLIMKKNYCAPLVYVFETSVEAGAGASDGKFTIGFDNSTTKYDSIGAED